jgi:hypothetical protein
MSLEELKFIMEETARTSLYISATIGVVSIAETTAVAPVPNAKFTSHVTFDFHHVKRFRRRTLRMSHLRNGFP